MITLNISLPVLELALAGIKTQLDQILKGQQKIMDNQTLVNDEIAKLKTAVDANTAAISALATLIATDTTTIANLNQQIADLKAANPAIDVSGIEAQIAALSANNTTAQGLVAPVTPPAPPSGPPTA